MIQARGATKAKYHSPPGLLRRTALKKLGYIIPVVLLMCVATLPLYAQEGCVDSPENPTAVLALLMGVASFGVAQLRNRIGSRKDK